MWKTHFLDYSICRKTQAGLKTCGWEHCRNQHSQHSGKQRSSARRPLLFLAVTGGLGDLQGTGTPSTSAPEGTQGKELPPGPQRDRGIPWGRCWREHWVCAGSTPSAKQLTHFILSIQKLHVPTYLTHPLAFKQSTAATINEFVHSSNFVWLKHPKNKVYSCFSQAIISNSSVNFTYRTSNYNNPQFRLSISSNK